MCALLSWFSIGHLHSQDLSPRNQQAEVQLNALYQQLRASLNASQKNDLKLKQRAWLVLREQVTASSADKEAAFYNITSDRVAFLSRALEETTSLQPSGTSKDSGRLLGTWSWGHHRHSSTISFHENGSYEMSSEDLLKDDQTVTTTSRGHWRLDGGHLYLIPEGKETSAPSKITFESPDSFTLDGFQTFKRDRQPATEPQDALAECLNKTKAIMDQHITQDDPLIRKLCTRRFKALLQKGFHTTPDDPMGFFECDVRYDTQDDYPKILEFGPAVSLGNCISVPIRLQSGSNAPFTKTWVYVRENGNWMADDLLTQKDGLTDRTSLADELEKYHPPVGSGSRK